MTTNISYAEAITFDTAMAVVIEALMRAAVGQPDESRDNADRPDLDVEQVIQDHLTAAKSG